MEISYLGHSCFKLKGKKGIVLTDPFDDYIGLKLPVINADIVTSSHDHKDHNAVHRVKPSSRRKQPFIIDRPGAYEVGGISIFGTESFHDNQGGVERGKNTIFVIWMDDIKICHLGDLGHELSNAQIAQIGAVDVLMVPVGGNFTIDAKQAIKLIKSLDPAYAIPMHYKTAQHGSNVFADVKPLESFLNEYGLSPAPEAVLKVEKIKLPEETELVVLKS